MKSSAGHLLHINQTKIFAFLDIDPECSSKELQVFLCSKLFNQSVKIPTKLSFRCIRYTFSFTTHIRQRNKNLQIIYLSLSRTYPTPRSNAVFATSDSRTLAFYNFLVPVQVDSQRECKTPFLNTVFSPRPICALIFFCFASSVHVNSRYFNAFLIDFVFC